MRTYWMVWSLKWFFRTYDISWRNMHKKCAWLTFCPEVKKSWQATKSILILHCAALLEKSYVIRLATSQPSVILPTCHFWKHIKLRFKMWEMIPRNSLASIHPFQWKLLATKMSRLFLRQYHKMCYWLQLTLLSFPTSYMRLVIRRIYIFSYTDMCTLHIVYITN